MGRSAGRKRKSHGGIRLNSIDEPVQDALFKLRAKRTSKLTSNQRRLLSSFDLAYNALPTELMTGPDLNLSMWSLIVHDTCLEKLATVQAHVAWPSTNQVADDATVSSIANLLPGTKRASSPTLRAKPAASSVRFNLQGAEHVTDAGVRHAISSFSGRLHALNLSRTAKLTDDLVRWVAVNCKNLHEIDLSHMPHLGGMGVAAIGEACPLLHVFSVHGCKHIPEFALLKVANGCPMLTLYDVSHCCHATDVVPRTLAGTCPNLQHFHAQGCKEISDMGILSLSNGCHDLLHVDLSRTDFQYKLTDMALLPLSERCKLLQHVNVAGCDYLTDAGLSWLAAGCSALAHLNVAHCVKLTDFSLRAIADGCIWLEFLDISGCPRISDVGLRYISTACRELHTLRLRSTILISDGMSLGRDNAQGLAALSHGCQRLQHLDLTKCLRVDDVACKQIARGFHDLRTLCLHECCKVSSDGIREMARHCHRLTQLDLSYCRLVDDAALVAMGSCNLPLLQSLRLRECERVTTAGIQSVCKGCTYIHTLDVTGCHRLDDMALLALSDHLMDLQHLWLAGLNRITIVGVSWLADRCTKLMELDVSNSAISYVALKPLRAAWKYGDLHEHHKARGIVPKHRAADMMFLDDYGTCWKAAIKIQSLYRAKVARRDAARRREEALIHWASSKMQSVFRGRQARKYAAVQRMLRRQQHDAATRIQAAYRAHVARTLTERLRKQREKERYVAMVIRVQSAWRRKQARDIFNSKRMLKLAIEARREASATVIQRAFRAYGWRKRNLLYSTALKVKKAEEEAAANKLQLLYKGRAARLEAQRKREALRLLQRKKDQAAQCLQRVIRRRRDKRLRQRQLDEEAKLNAAAQRIQRRFRRRQDMLSYQLMKLGREFQVRTEAALRLQAAWRRKQGHMAKHMLRVLKDEQYQRRVQAATKLQTRWRGRLGRAAAREAQQAAIQRLVKQAKMENHLATVIQAGWRGQKGRRRYREAVHARKRRWKEVPNTATGTKCYFHQDTGEIRQRMPQDLLDLLPKPRCNDCDVEAAMTECGDCGEFFCSECWHAIHAGGRRRRHRFRTLYDYYGKRIDYGDGEFPSVWPSEIAQDELDGWYLRTSPFREPVLVLGDWEKYVDDSTHREWYFSRSTKVSTYLPPPAFKATAQDIALAWVRKQDGPNQIPYYFNEKTGQRTFDRPPTFVEKEDADAALEVKGVEQVAAGVERAQPTPTDASSYGVDMGNGWMQYWDDTYQVYFYYNTYTQESTYTPPDGAMDSIAL
ncbi:hypothetical protein H310_01995 [Aphanomyces invadans]|uniref:WW domain-containing protein n=1 Tax=Aphanomyces invadans TaxID=157072 RepID=A0A024UNS2_9STRA|nr:hypothetical protein H310_01995 [Aphanomyces invadans]ETW07487.1 hypothetical protein H310_01995 [Aphanomyces invadans]|eukprot:XP_008863580.1 hypothetical protein H310_01995 [Aphanomyces invadans]